MEVLSVDAAEERELNLLRAELLEKHRGLLLTDHRGDIGRLVVDLLRDLLLIYALVLEVLIVLDLDLVDLEPLVEVHFLHDKVHAHEATLVVLHLV